ncbi:MAG TPA: SPW repeat protein [Gaiellaceae bacterium]|nr:SPW repeat protein [Gaiellaceae bacterium]
MATRERLRTRRRGLDTYDDSRPAPDEAYVEPEARSARGPMDDTAAAAALNVLAGIWLIISPFVLGYTGADATWNPIVFGAIVAVLALARLAGGVRAAGVSWINMAIGVWLFISAFWLASSSQASWNVGILGVIVFVLGAWASAPTGRVRAA